MKKLSIVAVLSVLLLMNISCDSPNPFGGPVYDVEGNLAKDKVKIDEFLATAPIDSLYRIHDPSGVVIIVQEEGTGSRPRANNVVYTNFIGSLLDGTVFDTNIEAVAKENDLYVETRNYRIFQFSVGSTSAIQGFNIGFQRLRSGSKATLIIPSPYGYRDSETIDGIPANSVLVFEVDFLGMD